MSEDTENFERVQVNISPGPETRRLLALAVERFGPKHRNAKTPNTAAADILDKFVHVWFALLEEQDKAYQQKAEGMIERGVSGSTKKKR